MNTKNTLRILVWIVILAPLVYLAIVWSGLPETIAMHYNLKGEVDRYGSKNELIFLALVLTAVNAGVYLLLSNVHLIDPKKKYALENKERMKRMGLVVSVFLSALLCYIIYGSTKSSFEPAPGIIFAGVGLLFCFLGNYMYTIKPNYFAGFRLPWTLENEDNWRKTHLLAGKIWFAGGLLIAIVSLLVPFKTAMIFFFTCTAAMVLIPGVYSYRMYKQSKG